MQSYQGEGGSNWAYAGARGAQGHLDIGKARHRTRRQVDLKLGSRGIHGVTLPIASCSEPRLGAGLLAMEERGMRPGPNESKERNDGPASSTASTKRGISGTDGNVDGKMTCSAGGEAVCEFPTMLSRADLRCGSDPPRLARGDPPRGRPCVGDTAWKSMMLVHRICSTSTVRVPGGASADALLSAVGCSHSNQE